MMIDAHHHLWDLEAVNYPWLMEKGAPRFFGDPTPIQRNYLIDEFRSDAAAQGFQGSVHIQVGAADPWAEAQWVQSISDANPDWPMAQVVFCDLTSPDLEAQLDRYQTLSTVSGVRQILGRAPGEDALTGTNALLRDPGFLRGLQVIGERGLSFDLQLIPELMEQTAQVLRQARHTPVALCHAGSPHDRSPEALTAWSVLMAGLADLPQIVCKISGLGMFQNSWVAYDFAPIVRTCLGKFGPDRCMFGSNFPVDSLYSDYDRLASTIWDLVPEKDRAAVFGTTAGKFYSLPH
jgi:predicted TIM-barrel fold metal-dependent hydrolase